MSPSSSSLWIGLALALLPGAALAQAIPPRLERPAQAEYPPAALAAGIEGEVVLELVVEADGAVSDARVVTPAGYGFDEAALAAARRFLFQPATQDGRPVRAQILYRYRFSLALRGRQANPLAAPLDPGDGRPPSSALGEADLVKILPPGELQGGVFERGTRSPIPFAQIAVIDPARKAAPREITADDQGRFTITGLVPGPCEIKVVAPGYEVLSSFETIPAEGALSVTLRLLPDAAPGYGLVVRGKEEEEEVTRRVLSAEELERIPGSRGDVLKAVQNLPGVARTFLGIGGLVVRGSAPEDTQVFLNGMPIPLIYHFGGLTSVISEDLLSGLSFVPGVYSARYGRGMGGIIDVETRLSAPPRLQGSLDTDIFDTGLSLRGPLPKGRLTGEGASFAVAARRSYIDLPLSLVQAAGAELGLAVAPHYWDYQAVAATPAYGGEVQLIAFGSSDRLELADIDIDGGAEESFLSLASRFHRLQGSWKQELAPGLSRRASASAGVSYSSLASFGDFEFELRDILGAARLDWASKLSENFALSYGADLQIHQLSMQGTEEQDEGEPPIQAQTLDPRADTAVYLEGRLSPLEGLILLPGLRVDWLGVSQELTVDPRLAARLALGPKTALKAGAGLFHQDPKPQDFILPDNPPPHVQYAAQVTLGAERKLLDERLDLDASVYYKHLYRQIVRDASFGELPSDFLTDEGEGRVAGLEILLRYPPKERFFGWVAYSLSRAERRVSPEAEWRIFELDQTHNLTAIGSYQLKRDVTVGGRFRLTSGNPYTPVVDAIYDADFDAYFPILGEENSARLPPFHQLDLRIDKRYRKDSWSLTLYLEITNVYSRRNPEFEPFYNFDFTQPQFPGGLPILPVLGLEGEF